MKNNAARQPVKIINTRLIKRTEIQTKIQDFIYLKLDSF